MRRMGAPAKLYLLVFVLSGFIIGMGCYGILQMNTMNQNTRTLYNDRVFSMDQLGDIRFFYESILYTAQQSKNLQITYKQALREVQRSEDSIGTNWKAYLLTYLTPEEKQLAGQAADLMHRSKPDIERLKKILAEEDGQAPGQISNIDLYGHINPVIIKITELINLQVHVSKDIYQNSHNNYIKRLNKFILLIILSLVFVIPFSYFLVGNIKDLIVDLRIGNKKTKEAEEKYRSFIKYAGDAIFILNEGLEITDVNDSGCNLLDFAKDELLKMKISDIMPPDEKESLSLKLNIINKLGGSLHERRFLRKDGSTVDTEMNVRILEGTGYISIIRDIIEQKKAAQAIRESEEKYKHLFENNPASIIVWDLENLNVLEVNNEVAKKYGYTKEEFKNATVLDYRHKDEHERIKAFARAMLSNDEPFLSSQWTHVKKNGEEMLMEISSHRIIYNNRKAILSLAIDVTERVKTQTALGKSEEKFHSLVDHAADAIFMVTDGGIIFDVNRSATEMLGYSKEESIGMTVLDLHLPEERSEVPQTWDYLRKNKTFTDERKLRRKDGTTVEVQISRTILPDATGAIAIVRDITERKKAENQLKLQNEKLLEIAFLQSHIVRRPAANIIGLINLINRVC